MNAITALTQFDKLVKAFAKQDCSLTDRQRRMLDDALTLHSKACSQLNLCPSQDNASRVADSFAKGNEA